MSILPSVNASLNATTAILLILGYTLIRQRAITAHTICMLAATATSAVFLGCYIYYHLHHGSTHFPVGGWPKVIYLTILISHSILAVVQLPYIFMTLFWAFRGDFFRHRKIAYIPLPMWLYVSVTGVIVYWMLYQVHWT